MPLSFEEVRAPLARTLLVISFIAHQVQLEASSLQTLNPDEELPQVEPPGLEAAEPRAPQTTAELNVYVSAPHKQRPGLLHNSTCSAQYLCFIAKVVRVEIAVSRCKACLNRWLEGSKSWQVESLPA